MQEVDRGSWNTRAGFLFAAVGSAVGLGNIWRFPYVCYKNGGGAFLIPYVIALFVIAIPLMLLEQSMGHRFRSAFPLACARISKKWEALGWWAVVFSAFGILLYYNVVIAWCANYLKFSFSLAWGEETQNFFFNTFLGVTEGPLDFAPIQWPIAIASTVMWFAVWWVVSHGVKKGIERVTRFFIPILFLQMIALVLWSLSLPGAGDGITQYLTPDVSRLSDPGVWSDAFTQIFFSCSLGFGVMCAYASYLPKRTHLLSNSAITCFMNSGFELFAGFAVFSTIGYMALMQNIPVADAVASGPGLAFITYPKAISLLPFGQKIFGVLFFSALLTAGFTSAISLLETFISSMVDKFGYARRKVVTLSCLVGAVGSLLFSMGNGIFLLDIVDHFLNNFGLLLMGMVEALLIGWIFGAHRLADHIRENGSFPLAGLWKIVIRWVIPVLLVALLIAETWRNLDQPYGGYSWTAIAAVGMGILVLTFAAAITLARRPAKNERRHPTHGKEN